jgi:hypothetical protein
MQLPVGTNIFGEQITPRFMPAENGTLTTQWRLMPNFEYHTNVEEFIGNLGPLTTEAEQLEPPHPTPHPGQDAVDYFL